MILAICGSSGAGKTTICRELQHYGYSMVSASQVAAEMYVAALGREPTRRELAEFGAEILGSTCRENDFRAQVLVKMKPEGNFVVDGLRSILTLEDLRARFGAIIVMIRRDSTLRLPRTSPTTGGEGDPELLRLSGKVDAHLDSPGFQFDLSVNNEASIQDTCAAILAGVGEIMVRRRPKSGYGLEQDNSVGHKET